ncbi:anthrone oxygenase family protein [Luteipulveratus halotolerans]|uniref:DUF1772 domain-containing protein n=1 Tax=Luteipulveratus halotolerans TaxID=1631356 RepID=A0A0L6CPF6_9MICO|nr:anthrone oxygenase family protein [Luteipulveratus halotolerans]KNX39418.1 hypothetical protein VV01_11815 [Luteipulveratus halotolerans]
MSSLRTAALLATTVTTGLMAGVYLTFSIAVLPGLSATDDRTFVLAERSINIKILNGWFAIVFGGPILLGVLAIILVAVADRRDALPWLITAVVLYAATLAVTFAVSIPLNDRLEATENIAEARKAFEDNWIRWNVVRTVLGIASFGALLGALRAHP